MDKKYKGRANTFFSAVVASWGFEFNIFCSPFSARFKKESPPTQVFLTFADWTVECHQLGQNFHELVASNQLLVPLAEHLESLVAAENLETDKRKKNHQEISYMTKRKGKVWDSVNKGKYLGQYPSLHFHKQFLVGLSLTSVSRQTKHCLEETLEEDDLPCNVPSNKEQSKTPSKKACYHYPDQTSPTPSLRHLHKVHKDLVTYLLSEK